MRAAGGGGNLPRPPSYYPAMPPRLLTLRRMATAAVLCAASPAVAQEAPDSAAAAKALADSLYIASVEDRPGRAKVLHAEPLFIDLIRDLGARKGEAEWNVGFGMTDRLGVDRYNLLVEYEWAPIDRLGLELEVPVSWFTAQPGFNGAPRNRVEGLKTAIQHTFLVSPEAQTSMAVGYLHEFLGGVRASGSDPGRPASMIINPFFVAARRWGDNTHTLLYTGPRLYRRGSTFERPVYEANVSTHWMITGTRNFIGVEVNTEIQQGTVDAVLRPQMRLGIADNLLVGIAVGIPIQRERERMGMFLRLIYEPGHRH